MISATGAITDFPLTLARDDGATAPSARGHRLAGGHGMMEVLRQESRYEPPAVPPFRRRDPAIVIDNPIVEVHAQIAAVLRE
jgi:hypothetical protein